MSPVLGTAVPAGNSQTWESGSHGCFGACHGDLGLGGWTPREEALLGVRELPGREQETALAEAAGLA